MQCIITCTSAPVEVKNILLSKTEIKHFNSNDSAIGTFIEHIISLNKIFSKTLNSIAIFA